MRRVSHALSFGGNAAIVVALSLYHSTQVADPPYSFFQSSRFFWATSYLIILTLATYALGFPDRPRSARETGSLSIVATLIATVGISSAQLVLGFALLPRFVLFTTPFLVIVWQVLLNVAVRKQVLLGAERDRVLIVGASAECDRFKTDVGMEPERPCVGAGELRLKESGDLPDSNGSLADAVAATQATMVVLDRTAQSNERIVGEVVALHQSGVRVRTLEIFYEEWLGKLPLSELVTTSLLFDIGEIHNSTYTRTSRLFDLLLSSIGLLALVCLTPFVFMGNLVGNRGPLFFRQIRTGKDGKEFTILKFRTMVNGDTPEANSDWTSHNDPRVTRFGRILRSSHLDELPQVINIFRGELAVVGPRPEQPRYVAELKEQLEFYELRHLVRPGLTGWAQVKYGYAGDEEDALEKLQYEFFYLRHQNLQFDAQVAFRTLRSLGRAR